MNNWILFAVLFIFFISLLKVNKMDFVEPSVLFCSGFFIGSLFLALNTKNWSYEIRWNTICVICVSILLFAVGSRFGKKIKVHLYSRRIAMNFNINYRFFCALLAILIIGCIVIRIADLYEATGGLTIFTGAIEMYRFNPGESRFTSMIKICDACVSAIVIYAVHVLIEKIMEKEKRKIYFVCIILLGLTYYVLSSSRIEIIYIFIYIIIDYAFGIRYSGKKIGIKELRYMVTGILVLFAVFFASGYLTGKSQVQSSAFDNISLYAGSSIGALNRWLETYSYTGEYFGSIIFSGIANFVGLFGIDMGLVADPHITFINLGTMSHTTNVFTCIAELMSDVGIVGCLIILFIEGTISQILYKKAKEMLIRGNRFMFFIYLYLAPLIVLSTISERFFSTFFTVSTIVFMILIKYILGVDDTNRKRVNKM